MYYIPPENRTFEHVFLTVRVLPQISAPKQELTSFFCKLPVMLNTINEEVENSILQVLRGC